jgi:hypothetical protein
VEFFTDKPFLKGFIFPFSSHRIKFFYRKVEKITRTKKKKKKFFFFFEKGVHKHFFFFFVHDIGGFASQKTDKSEWKVRSILNIFSFLRANLEIFYFAYMHERKAHKMFFASWEKGRQRKAERKIKIREYKKISSSFLPAGGFSLLYILCHSYHLSIY